MNEITYIPYKQYDEIEKKAGLVQVNLDLADVPEQQIQLIGYLCQAARAGCKELYNQIKKLFS